MLGEREVVPEGDAARSLRGGAWNGGTTSGGAGGGGGPGWRWEEGLSPS